MSSGQMIGIVRGMDGGIHQYVDESETKKSDAREYSNLTMI
jgi:hypothetical protein